MDHNSIIEQISSRRNTESRHPCRGDPGQRAAAEARNLDRDPNADDESGAGRCDSGTAAIPCYNVISIGTPIIGFLAALVFLTVVGFHRPDVQGGTLMLGTAISILGGSWFVGFVLAIIALVRSERLWGLTSLGILLNAPLLLVLPYVGYNWLRFG